MLLHPQIEVYYWFAADSGILCELGPWVTQAARWVSPW